MHKAEKVKYLITITKIGKRNDKWTKAGPEKKLNLERIKITEAIFQETNKLHMKRYLFLNMVFI